jgi:hypothetical protein
VVTVYLNNSKPPRKDRCETCKYFSGSACHRHPPVIDKDDTAWSAWPAVGSKGWCGEYASKKQEA